MSSVIAAAAPRQTVVLSFHALALPEQYRLVRAFTESLTAPLAPEDQVVQSMTDVSPTKWHLAHTTWFWETFALAPYLEGYELHHPDYAYLFNSYYVQAGERHCRARRGYLSRPTVAEVMDYRRYVDEHMDRLLTGSEMPGDARLAEIVRIGLNHEQQHQELILTDIKHVLSVNPLRPVYQERPHVIVPPQEPLQWISFGEGLHKIGYDPAVDGPFSFDNELPRHRAFVEPFALGDRLVTCGEFIDFIEDGGYGSAPLWLSEGYAAAEAGKWTEPFYWENRDGEWWQFTLHGMRPVQPGEPLTHVSYFEADAYARWAGHRLATEVEWEVAASDSLQGREPEGNFVESRALHPAPPSMVGGNGAPATPRLRQLFGDAWEWTQSHYSPYPGYAPECGALGEYNGKWMCNQFVLRGGSCATSRTHVRTSYRNFFHPASSWQFSGIRLARSL